MIESSSIQRKHDRLTAFLKAFTLSATQCDAAEMANLLIVDSGRSGRPTHLLYRARAAAALPDGMALCAAAKVDFGGSANPLVGALPEELCFSLTEEPQWLGLSELIVAEVQVARCGGGALQARLCEIVVVLAIRKAIAIGTVNAGLLAGLAHPRLHASLVAMHDDPMRNWQIADLAAIAGMSRGPFIAAFKQTIGQPPGAYLTGWRLALGRAELHAGRSVKSVAAMVGFGSAAAFSRAYSRKFGCPPIRSKGPR
ncbi:AraC family transcriptional regulator [Prosthecomicrobium hirschii]|uniref:AraC family transcriptional regulator n=1 Tax=Prosthecodimorpha hirschii TaxID=665126 RepID=UPI001125DFAA|nr:AraC family transcriptional regulator [Prosthecomicrobium hirschii]TPQ48711.1 AraC family transcriptional regulator [Prosthecomicrobium hirschii]